MKDDTAQRLLAADEPAAFEILRPDGASPLLLICDHASRRIPRALGSLGVADADLATHIGWDIGAAAVARELARLLDATLVLQNYSRLVVDCNRPPAAADSIPPTSAGVRIPGNEGLDERAIAARREGIFEPYHAAIERSLEQRAGGAGRTTVILAIHSFTPVFRGQARPWHAGVMFNRDARFGRALLAGLRGDPLLHAGENEPYAMGDASDYSLPIHGERRGIAHAGLEIRQDLVAARAGQLAWAHRLASLLPRALEELRPDVRRTDLESRSGER